jgi:hypothetical protein
MMPTLRGGQGLRCKRLVADGREFLIWRTPPPPAPNGGVDYGGTERDYSVTDETESPAFLDDWSS